MATKLDQYEEIIGTTLEDYLGAGGLAGEFNKNYYRWNENPTAFYESMTYPYVTIYEDIVDDRYSKKYLQPVQDEIDRIITQGKFKDPSRDGYFKMGTVELTIPPIQISINEVKQNYMCKTLRTSSDIVLQSGKSTKIVELDIYFHDIDDINNKLRPLLAQLKCVPFVPIYSDYLKEILDPSKSAKREIARSEKAKAISDANAKIARRRHDLIEAINKDPRMIDVGTNPKAKPNLVPDILSYWEGDLNSLNSSGIDPTKPLSDSMKTIMTEMEIPDTWLLKGGIINLTLDVETDVRSFKDIKNTNFAEMESITFDRNIVGVLSQLNVATVAGFPESLVCHATFFMFNYFPFSESFEFLDNSNKPTTDIDKCLYFVQWYASRFLNQDGDSRDGNSYFRPLESEMKGELSFEYIKEDVVTNKDGDRVIRQTPLPTVTLDSNTVCAAIVVSQRNSISFLPVLQWSVPTCQYMGASNTAVELTIDTLDDDFIERIKHMIDLCEKFTREGDKVTRNNYIRVENEVLALLGIEQCVVDGFQTSTVPGSPGMTRIQIKLIEFNPRQMGGEVIARQKDIPENVQLEYFKNDVQKYLDEINFANYEVVSKTPLRDFLYNTDIYKKAAGHNVVIDDSNEYSPAYSGPFSIIALSDKGVAFDHEKKRINYLKEVINSYGSQDVDKNRTVNQGLRFSSSKNVSTDLPPRFTYIKVKDSRTSEERDYNYIDKRNIANYLKSYLSNTSHTKRVEDIPNSVLYLIFKTDDLSTYRETAINNIKNFVNGTGSNLPEDLQERLSRSKLLLDIKRKSTRYPDMTLPEYATTKRVGVGAPKITYGDLGKPSPEMRQLASPRTDGDIVEPDFYFRNGADIDIDDINDKYTQIFEQEYERILSDIGENVDAQMRESEKGPVISTDDQLKTAVLEAKYDEEEAKRNATIVYKDGTIGPALIPTTEEDSATYEKYLEERHTLDNAKYSSDTDVAKRLYDKVTRGEGKQYYQEVRTTVTASDKNIYGLNVDPSKREPEEQK